MSTHDIQGALASKAFEIIEIQEAPNQLRVIGRLPEDDPILDNWWLVLHRLLFAMQKANWKIDPSKKYELRGEDGKVIYKWRLIFQGTNISQYYGQIAQHIKAAPRSNRTEVTKFQLTGGRSRKYDDRVGPAGKIAVGAAARRR